MSNEKIFNESKRFMPGGVNSPVRAYKGLGINPPIIKSGKGAVIVDEDGKEYIDFVLAWGPLILGHCNDKVVGAIKDTSEKALAFGAPTNLELEMSKFICENMPVVEMVRMVNSGTEATMSAIKLARGYTKRDKIVKFAGCYHGHFDGFLVEAGSGVLTEGIPGSQGVPEDSVKNTLIGIYNAEKQVANLFKKYGNEIAAVIIEPVAGNMGVIKAKNEFMQVLRTLCNRYGALLIFDEVMSGFRVSFKGAQSLFNVSPDLVTYAKIMGGGLPSGAYGGKREIMENLSPKGGVYQAGTMSGNPIVMSAGLATLNELHDHPEYYNHIESVGRKLEDGLYKVSEKYNLPICINRVGGMMTLFFSEEKVDSYDKVKKCNIERFNRYFIHMLNSGINLPPSQFESFFLSTAHNITHVYKFVKAFEEFAKKEIN
ncbi:glutamate-1-semialdehyde 2,1-aminomutase [Clostridium sp. SHJSY1]|uniref:glutamate-1-semialdehyde 2,1-aminomutase n=1 Tax=Clostridium sp. SHJSY1 TaxID=2942483 RepID=UPI002874D31B|nr:glutamate-1-semialdehyde 2,1-aminomutase [Clostridium sp. SHJSY1]MDS0524254.1 glutamate-1-semialdehyde 2,1-aminomutase [Clostridium sp. SHJSY1]